MELQLAPIGDLILAFLYALIVGSITLVLMVFRILYYGPWAFFSKKKRPYRPALVDDPKLGEHHYARLKRVTMHYVTKGDKDKPCIVFIHGFPDFWYSWHNQLEALSDEFYVIAPDMRGYGETSKPKEVHEYTVDKLIGDLKELLDSLGIKRITVVGHDWGGALAWSFAMQYPDATERLVACNAPNLYAYFERSKTSLKQLAKSWYQAVDLIPYYGEFFIGLNDLQFIQDVFTKKGQGPKPGTFSDEEIEAYKYVFQTYDDRVGIVNYDRALSLYKFPIPETNYVRCPTLILWGTNDAWLENETAEMSKPYVKNECTLKFLDGYSHWIQHEAPEIVNDNIRSFMHGKVASK